MIIMIRIIEGEDFRAEKVQIIDVSQKQVIIIIMDFIIFCLVAVIVKINLSSVIEKTVMLKGEKKERKCTDLFDILGVSSREMTH